MNTLMSDLAHHQTEAVQLIFIGMGKSDICVLSCICVCVSFSRRWYIIFYIHCIMHMYISVTVFSYMWLLHATIKPCRRAELGKIHGERVAEGQTRFDKGAVAIFLKIFTR